MGSVALGSGKTTLMSEPQHELAYTSLDPGSRQSRNPGEMT